ncbi:OmpA family protein [uncultured Microscilla sp.]|uniref:OmpA family protein n=1 Tax=uncultured Microscilla sp. TaxID=432653 RepID=UPI00262F90FF|nr:OmpA family protein [uncultured Microscilla sp.]
MKGQYKNIFILSILVTLLWQTSAYSQRDREFSDAKNLYEYESYEAAKRAYLQILKKKPGDIEVQYQLGVCYLRTLKKDSAVFYLENVYAKNSDHDPHIEFVLGKAYHYNNRFADAIKYYNLAKKEYATLIQNGKSSMSNYELEARTKACDKRIKECTYGASYVEQPMYVKIRNVGKKINSEFPDYAPIFPENEKFLVFTSRRKGTTGGKKDATDDHFFEDVYIAYKNGKEWSPPKNIGNKINTKYHDASISLSQDGNTLFLYKDRRAGDIYESELDTSDSTWKKPRSMGKNINSKYRETSITMTRSKDTVYFASDRPGGFGGLDIYMSIKDKKGRWGDAVNLGKQVNTIYNEDSPYIMPDGKLLYFSSEGHSSMGGYDIFFTNKNKEGKWGEAYNMGYPINTSDDDIYFVISADGMRGYYASVKGDTEGEKDIYEIYHPTGDNILALKPEKKKKDSILQTQPKVLLTGVISNKDNQDKIKAVVRLYEKSTTQIAEENNTNVSEEVSSNPNNGVYKATMVKTGKNYMVLVRKKGFYQYKKEVNIPTNITTPVKEDIPLTKIKPGDKLGLQVLFGFDSYQIQPQYIAHLDSVANYLKEYTEMVVEISGHTDNIGNRWYNNLLAKRRSQAVMNYLINKKGIPAAQVVFKGYADAKPLGTNTTATGRALNRRVDGIVIKVNLKD